MQFCVGDKVREGLHVGTVTDVGGVLIEVKTTIGDSRMVCPSGLVKCAPHTTPSAPTQRHYETAKTK